MLKWYNRAWREYVEWQHNDPKITERINVMLEELIHHPFTGIGKPEPLKGEFAGCWSRRIDDKNRLIYDLLNGDIEILMCKGHYSDR